MSARDVADMMVVAYEGYQEAIATSDPELLTDCLTLMTRALAHPHASRVFAGLQQALADAPDIDSDPVDPELDRNDAGALDTETEPDVEDVQDGAGEGASPVDAGVIPDDTSDRRPTEVSTALLNLGGVGLLGSNPLAIALRNLGLR